MYCDTCIHTAGDQSGFGTVLVASQMIIPVIIICAIVQAIWSVVWAAYITRYGVGIPPDMFDGIPFIRRFQLVGRRDPDDLEWLRIEVKAIHAAKQSLLASASGDDGDESDDPVEPHDPYTRLNEQSNPSVDTEHDPYANLQVSFAPMGKQLCKVGQLRLNFLLL